MLLASKKSGEKSDVKQDNAWHPNFADGAKLPDVKVVRTKFFVNSISLVVMGSALLFVGQYEYSVYQLQSDLLTTQQDISANKADSSKAVITYGKFKAEEKKLVDVINLSSESLVFSDYIIHLGNTLPDRVTLQKIIHRGAGQSLSLTITVQGLDAVSVDIASKYVKQLQDDLVFKDYISAVTLNNTIRNVPAKNLTLEVSMAVKAPKK